MPSGRVPFTFPDHVPDNLRWDHSLREFSHELDDPFKAAARLHNGPDIIFAREAAPHRSGWIITRHALQSEVFVDYEHFRGERGSGLAQALDKDFRFVPLEYDPPEQTIFRRIINPFFTPKAIKEMESAVRGACDQLIAEFADRGECEFISEFAIPFPSYIFLSLVGLPAEEAPQFLAWEESMLRGGSFDERLEAGRAVFAYLKAFAEAQKRAPGTDLMRAIASAEVNGRPIADLEIVGLLYTFYLGGLDTVYSTLGWIMRHLATDRNLQQNLRQNPDIIPRAVDEFARAYSVVSTTRQVAKDYTFHGVEMRKGDIVLLPLFLAGRDPAVWDKADEINLDRRAGALTFASGPHLCVGRHLARREMCIAIESFLTRFGNIHIVPGDAYAFHTSAVFGVDRLRLAWATRSLPPSANRVLPTY